MQEPVFKLIDGVLYAVMADIKGSGFRIVRVGKV